MNKQLQPSSTLRAEIYLVLAALFRHAPNREMIDFLRSLQVEPLESEMQKAWLHLQQAAIKADLTALQDEYQNLFIGIGRGEVMPFGSWHRSGTIMEKPLVELRHDLAQLGIERHKEVKEPEDHIAALCEVMSMLTNEAEERQQALFNKHIAPWYHCFVSQLKNAANADFYKAVAQLCDAFLTLEQVRFSAKEVSIK